MKFNDDILAGLDAALFEVFGQPVWLLGKDVEFIGILHDRLREPTVGTLPASLSEPVLSVLRADAVQIAKGDKLRLSTFGTDYHFRVSEIDALAHDSLIVLILTPYEVG